MNKCDECLKEFNYPLREVKDVKGNPVHVCKGCNLKFVKKAYWFLDVMLRRNI